MSSIKDALARVSRVILRYDQVRSANKPLVLLPTRPSAPAQPRHIQKPPRERIPKHEMDKVRPHLKGFLRKRYQKFLEPLDMPQLKIYDDGLPKYDVLRAEHILANKKSSDRQQIFANYLEEKHNFEKMMNLLVELTPRDLMDKNTVENLTSLTHVLKREELQFRATRYDHIPRYHFHEVPPIPQPLTQESFQEYIYFLTHLKMLYRNSSSLMSGIVPEILLHTHHLENTQFKPFRTVETYNYLIKFFGYEKFQNSFSRELLLVMVHDGHSPNINTINQLMKTCRIHASRRSLVSTYKVVVSYLSLAKKLDLSLNLATWNRVYDCIHNIYLKEAFLNKMLAVCLPVLNNMCIQILNDYCETTHDTAEVITFMELDLRRPNWRNDPRMAEKVLRHRVKHMTRNEELSSIFELWLQIATDAVSLKVLLSAIDENPHFTHTSFLALCTYVQLSKDTTSVAPENYSRLLKMLCENKENYDISVVNLIVRGIVHCDATKTLNLPTEVIKYEDPSKARRKQTAFFPYHIPKGHFGENYRIIKRLSYASLIMLEAKVLYANRKLQARRLKSPWVPLAQKDRLAWESIMEQIKTQTRFWEDTPEKAESVGFVVSKTPQASKDVITAYEKHNSVQMRVSHEISTVKKLREGFDKCLEREMRERKIQPADFEEA